MKSLILPVTILVSSIIIYAGFKSNSDAQICAAIIGSNDVGFGIAYAKANNSENRQSNQAERAVLYLEKKMLVTCFTDFDRN